MKLSVGKKTFIGFAASFAILCVMGVVTYRNTSELIHSLKRVAQSFAVMADLADVASVAKDLQTGARGYVITGNEEFLDPYYHAVESIGRRVQNVSDVIKDEPDQQERLDKLKTLLAREQSVTTDIIRLRKTKGLETAAQSVQEGGNRQAMHDIVALIGEMNAHETLLLVRRERDSSAWARTTVFVVVAGSLLALITTGAAMWVVRRDFAQRQQLEEALVQASERESERIGQDLHDGLCQQLTGIGFMARVLHQRLASKALPDATDAGKIEKFIGDSVNHARALARGLHPIQLQSNGLTLALEELASNVPTLFGVACEFKCPENVPTPTGAPAVHLYRIAQEAVHNAVRHGKPTQITISLAERNGKVLLEITDNGIGLRKTPSKSTGMGLETMRYRARAIGAALELLPAAPQGTMVRCTFKKAAERADLSEKNALENAKS